MNEWKKKWMNDGVIEWKNKWMNNWKNEWMNEIIKMKE
jgi:hypothetical protein